MRSAVWTRDRSEDAQSLLVEAECPLLVCTEVSILEAGGHLGSLQSLQCLWQQQALPRSLRMVSPSCRPGVSPTPRLVLLCW